MTNSDRSCWLGALVGALATCTLPWALGCASQGDLETMGCPEGEVCAPGPGLYFSRATAIGCSPFEGLVDGSPYSRNVAVALGGTSWARVGGHLRTVSFTSEFEPISMNDDGGTVRAVREGEGRFEVRALGRHDVADGVLLDYVALPVVPVARVVVSDYLACTDEEVALLRGVPVRLRALPFASDDRPLVDTTASVRSLAGEDVVTPTVSERATVRLLVASTSEIATLPVVDAADEIVPRQRVVAQLRGELELGVLGELCFQARADGVSLLGVPLSAARPSAHFRPVWWWDDTERRERAILRFPSCVFLEPDPGHRDEPAFIEIEMAGLTARYDVAE